MAELYYPWCENKGADQLYIYCTAELHLCFSHMQIVCLLVWRIIHIYSNIEMIKVEFIVNSIGILLTLFLLDNVYKTWQAIISFGDATSKLAR